MRGVLRLLAAALLAQVAAGGGPGSGVDTDIASFYSNDPSSIYTGTLSVDKAALPAALWANVSAYQPSTSAATLQTWVRSAADVDRDFISACHSDGTVVWSIRQELRWLLLGSWCRPNDVTVSTALSNGMSDTVVMAQSDGSNLTVRVLSEVNDMHSEVSVTDSGVTSVGRMTATMNGDNQLVSVVLNWTSHANVTFVDLVNVTTDSVTHVAASTDAATNVTTAAHNVTTTTSVGVGETKWRMDSLEHVVQLVRTGATGGCPLVGASAGYFSLKSARRVQAIVAGTVVETEAIPCADEACWMHAAVTVDNGTVTLETSGTYGGSEVIHRASSAAGGGVTLAYVDPAHPGPVSIRIGSCNDNQIAAGNDGFSLTEFRVSHGVALGQAALAAGRATSVPPYHDAYSAIFPLTSSMSERTGRVNASDQHTGTTLPSGLSFVGSPTPLLSPVAVAAAAALWVEPNVITKFYTGPLVLNGYRIGSGSDITSVVFKDTSGATVGTTTIMAQNVHQVKFAVATTAADHTDAQLSVHVTSASRGTTILDPTAYPCDSDQDDAATPGARHRCGGIVIVNRPFILAISPGLHAAGYAGSVSTGLPARLQNISGYQLGTGSDIFKVELLHTSDSSTSGNTPVTDNSSDWTVALSLQGTSIVEQSDHWVVVLLPATLDLGYYGVRVYSPVTQSSAEPRVVSTQAHCMAANADDCRILCYGIPRGGVSPGEGPYTQLLASGAGSTAGTSTLCGRTIDVSTTVTGYSILSSDAGAPAPTVTVCGVAAIVLAHTAPNSVTFVTGDAAPQLHAGTLPNGTLGRRLPSGDVPCDVVVTHAVAEGSYSNGSLHSRVSVLVDGYIYLAPAVIGSLTSLRSRSPSELQLNAVMDPAQLGTGNVAAANVGLGFAGMLADADLHAVLFDSRCMHITSADNAQVTGRLHDDPTHTCTYLLAAVAADGLASQGKEGLVVVSKKRGLSYASDTLPATAINMGSSAALGGAIDSVEPPFCASAGSTVVIRGRNFSAGNDLYSVRLEHTKSRQHPVHSADAWTDLFPYLSNGFGGPQGVVPRLPLNYETLAVGSLNDTTIVARCGIKSVQWPLEDSTLVIQSFSQGRTEFTQAKIATVLSPADETSRLVCNPLQHKTSFAAGGNVGDGPGSGPAFYGPAVYLNPSTMTGESLDWRDPRVAYQCEIEKRIRNVTAHTVAFDGGGNSQFHAWVNTGEDPSVDKNLRIAAREEFASDLSYGRGERVLVAGVWYGTGQGITVQVKINNTLRDIVDGTQRIDVIERPACGGRGFAIQNETGSECAGAYCTLGTVQCMCFNGFTGPACEGTLFGAAAAQYGVFSKLVAGGADGASYVSEDSGATWLKQTGVVPTSTPLDVSDPGVNHLLQAPVALRDVSSDFGRVLRSFVPLSPVVEPTEWTAANLAKYNVPSTVDSTNPPQPSVGSVADELTGLQALSNFSASKFALPGSNGVVQGHGMSYLLVSHFENSFRPDMLLPDTDDLHLVQFDSGPAGDGSFYSHTAPSSSSSGGGGGEDSASIAPSVVFAIPTGTKQYADDVVVSAQLIDGTSGCLATRKRVFFFSVPAAGSNASNSPHIELITTLKAGSVVQALRAIPPSTFSSSASPGKCFVVGTNGTFVSLTLNASDAAGRSSLTVDTAAPLQPAGLSFRGLTTVDFFDANYGVVGGDDGFVAATADGGVTWDVAAFQPPYKYGVAAVSLTHHAFVAMEEFVAAASNSSSGALNGDTRFDFASQGEHRPHAVVAGQQGLLYVCDNVWGDGAGRLPATGNGSPATFSYPDIAPVSTFRAARLVDLVATLNNDASPAGSSLNVFPTTDSTLSGSSVLNGTDSSTGVTWSHLDLHGSNTGTVSDSHGHMMRTEDGGLSWFPVVPTAATASLAAAAAAAGSGSQIVSVTLVNTPPEIKWASAKPLARITEGTTEVIPYEMWDRDGDMASFTVEQPNSCQGVAGVDQECLRSGATSISSSAVPIGHSLAVNFTAFERSISIGSFRVSAKDMYSGPTGSRGAVDEYLTTYVVGRRFDLDIMERLELPGLNEGVEAVHHRYPEDERVDSFVLTSDTGGEVAQYKQSSKLTRLRTSTTLNDVMERLETVTFPEGFAMASSLVKVPNNDGLNDGRSGTLYVGFGTRPARVAMVTYDDSNMVIAKSVTLTWQNAVSEGALDELTALVITPYLPPVYDAAGTTLHEAYGPLPRLLYAAVSVGGVSKIVQLQADTLAMTDSYFSVYASQQMPVGIASMMVDDVYVYVTGLFEARAKVGRVPHICFQENRLDSVCATADLATPTITTVDATTTVASPEHTYHPVSELSRPDERDLLHNPNDVSTVFFDLLPEALPDGTVVNAGVRTATMDPYQHVGYFGINSSPGYVARVNLLTFSAGAVDLLALQSNESHPSAVAIDPFNDEGGHVYFATLSMQDVRQRVYNTAGLVRVNIDGFTVGTVKSGRASTSIGNVYDRDINLDIDVKQGRAYSISSSFPAAFLKWDL